MVPGLFVAVLFAISFRRFVLLYRRIQDRPFPLTGSELPELFQKDPAGFIKQMPVMPFVQWKAIFKKYSNSELDQAAKKTQRMFRIFVFVVFGNLLLHGIVGFSYALWLAL